MPDDSTALLNKARGILEAARLCRDHGLHDSAVSRAYYAMFWAAVAALAQWGITKDLWSHRSLRSTFSFEMIRKRGLFPVHVGVYLTEGLSMRIAADYHIEPMTEADSGREITGAEEMLARLEVIFDEGNR